MAVGIIFPGTMEQTDHRRDARQFIIQSATDEGWKAGLFLGLLVGMAIRDDFTAAGIGGAVGAAIGWLVGKYNSRLL